MTLPDKSAPKKAASRKPQQSNSNMENIRAAMMHDFKLNPNIARRAIVLSEIIGPPVSKRHRGRRP